MLWKKHQNTNQFLLYIGSNAVFLPIFYPIGCYSSVFTLIFPIVFCSSRTRQSSRCAFSLYSWWSLISLRNRLFSSWRSWRSLARSVARLSAFAFASVAWTISSGATAPGTRPWREPTTGKQYIPSSGNQSGTAAEEATRRRTRPAQEKKPGFWNGYVISELRAWFFVSIRITL